MQRVQISETTSWRAGVIPGLESAPESDFGSFRTTNDSGSDSFFFGSGADSNNQD